MTGICAATQANGRPCSYRARPGTAFCGIHVASTTITDVSNTPSVTNIEPATVAHEDYRIAHRAPNPSDDYSNPITQLFLSFPREVFDHPDWFSSVPDEEGMTQLRAALDQPDTLLTIYRAVPSEIENISSGDWVTLSRAYAVMHTESESGWIVLERRVSASSVFTDGNDLNEFGYHDDANPDLVVSD